MKNLFRNRRLFVLMLLLIGAILTVHSALAVVIGGPPVSVPVKVDDAPPPPAPTPLPAITDNRVNVYDTFETRKAFFMDMGNKDESKNGIFIYDFSQDSSGKGFLICYVTGAALLQLPDKPAENTLLYEGQPDSTKANTCQIWKLTTGEYQANIGPEMNGLVRVWIWQGVPPKAGSMYRKDYNIYG